MLQLSSTLSDWLSVCYLGETKATSQEFYYCISQRCEIKPNQRQVKYQSFSDNTILIVLFINTPF